AIPVGLFVGVALGTRSRGALLLPGELFRFPFLLPGGDSVLASFAGGGLGFGPRFFLGGEARCLFASGFPLRGLLGFFGGGELLRLGGLGAGQGSGFFLPLGRFEFLPLLPFLGPSEWGGAGVHL